MLQLKKNLLIIIPVYNEQEKIGSLIDELRKQKFEEIADLLVIDDGSTDNTQAILEEKQVRAITKPYNSGYGLTLQLGYKYATDQGYDYLIQIDGDGQHDLCNIMTVYETLTRPNNGPDIVIGSRFLSKENQMKPSKLKIFAIYLFSQIIYFFTKTRITDPTSGMQGLNRLTFSYYAKYGNFDYQYPDINMIIQMLLMGFKIEEVPALMYERTSGKGMHAGMFKPIKYMVLISLSTLTVLIRQREGYYQLRNELNEGE